jgi:flagellar biosynthesis protein FliR
MAGEVMSRIGALSLSDVFDPTFDTNVPLFSRLLVLVGTAVFVGIGGHRLLMGGLLETFQKIPPGGLAAAVLDSPSGAGTGLLPSVVDTLMLLTAASFQLAIRASAPVVAALLLSMLVLGLISRTLPQLNVLMVGFGVNAILTFGVFALSMGAAVMLFQEQIEPTIATLLETLTLPIRSP